MADVDPRIEAFFANAGKWREELTALRAILNGCPVAEDFKWRSPCYTFRKRNVATIWGFKDHCALSFFKGVLLADAEHILVAPGENSRSVRLARFTSVAHIAGMESILKDYVREAVEVEKARRKVDFRKDDLELPGELVDRLEKDPDLKAAFEALTPGRRRGYILHFSQPRQSATRASRIEKRRSRILDGKGLHDR